MTYSALFAKGKALTRTQIRKLKTGDKVEVVWTGGNGPHIYEIRNDLSELMLYRTSGSTNVRRLLDGYHFVAVANIKLCSEQQRMVDLLNGVRPIVELWQAKTPAQKVWKDDWLREQLKAINDFNRKAAKGNYERHAP